MEDGGLNERLGRRIRGLRAARGLSLDALAGRSGVSRSMISLVERGEASATAVVLDRLATAFDVPLAALFDAADSSHSPGEPVLRRADQPIWRDGASGYLRRNVSPSGVGSPIRIVDVEFPPGARVVYETGARPTPVPHLVWVLDGTLEVTVAGTTHRLDAGDCLAFVLDVPVSYHNPADIPARYAVVVIGEP